MNNLAEKIEPVLELVEATLPLNNDLWDDVESFLQLGLDEASSMEWEIDDVRHFVEGGRGHLLIGLRDKVPYLAVVYEVEVYYKIKTLNVYLMGAEPHSDWLPFMDSMIDYARSIGCQTFKGAGRKGWAKVLKRYGKTKLVYEWELKL